MLLRIKEARLELGLLSGSNSAGLRACAFSRSSCLARTRGLAVTEQTPGSCCPSAALVFFFFSFFLFQSLCSFGAVLCIAEVFPPLLHLTKTFGVICWKYWTNLGDGGWYETGFRLSFNSVSFLTQPNPLHLYIQQLLFKHLPYVRHSSEPWGNSCEQNKAPALSELII